jgi:chemotaxis methyl-accepting protein methylase
MGYSIGERLRATGIGDVASTSTRCARRLAERQRLIDEVTIQETHFFRNPPQMRALRAHVLPELLGTPPRTAAGCASGAPAAPPGRSRTRSR